MFCEKCGADVAEGSVYCSGCGARQGMPVPHADIKHQLISFSTRIGAGVREETICGTTWAAAPR